MTKVDMLTDEEFAIEVGFKTKITFYLKMISTSEERAYTKRFVHIADLPDNEHAKKEFAIIVDTLGKWSFKMPTIKGGKTGDEDLPLGEGTPSEAIKAYFSEMTNPNERIVQSVMIAFRNAMTPDVRFL